MFNVGDIVEINPSDRTAEWKGLRAKVIRTDFFDPYLSPLSPRPDRHGFNSFYWPRDQIVLVSSEGPRDFLGRVIKVGDSIVYPGRSGSALWMNAATVEEVLVDKIKVLSKNKLVTLNRLDRVVVV
jgi:hypothetical protein